MFWSTFESIVNAAAQAQENEKNRKFQAEQASLDREENFLYNEQAAKNADKRSRSLFNDLLSPLAQLKQFKAAGLSPSLMFGGSGVGGTSVPSGAQGNGASGIHTNYGANYISPLEGAQTALLTAQAEKVREETKTIEGKNERGKAEIAGIFAGTELKGAETRLKNAVTYAQHVQNLIMDETYDSSVSRIKSEAEKAAHEAQSTLWESKSAEVNFTILDATKQEKIKQIENATKEQVLRMLQIQTQNKLTEMEIEKIGNEISQRWTELQTLQMNAQKYADYVDAQKKYWEDYLTKYAEELEITKRGQNFGLIGTGITAAATLLKEGFSLAGALAMIK